ncbi:MAG: DUF1512 domain-containing protein [Thaumarchaeota archaeon]|nr:DUF1512 domain-containing protein [Nitrososphaerota archaeon]
MLVFFLLFTYGQRFQTRFMLVGVRKSLVKLETFRSDARKRFIESVLQHNADRDEVDGKVDRLIDSFAITPVSMDPKGVMGKLDHILTTYDNNLKTEVRSLVKGALQADVNTLTNLLEVSIGLDTMFRVVRHYYVLASKKGGMLASVQLQLSLPSIMEEADAYNAAIDAFAKGKTVGDGIGPLLASQFAASSSEGREYIEDTTVTDAMFEGRKLLIVKAKGPGGNVGKPGLAIEKLVQESGPVSLIITVDAALKLEGEESGQVAEGVGAAIGGPGVERYRIEEAAVKSTIPTLAVVVKMSSKEAISEMTPKIREALNEASNRVKRAILSSTKLGDIVILAGIGNTLGVA